LSGEQKKKKERIKGILRRRRRKKRKKEKKREKKGRGQKKEGRIRANKGARTGRKNAYVKRTSRNFWERIPVRLSRRWTGKIWCSSLGFRIRKRVRRVPSNNGTAKFRCRSLKSPCERSRKFRCLSPFKSHADTFRNDGANRCRKHEWELRGMIYRYDDRFDDRLITR